jgi:tetratricopeptide (TPR) repeat protein
MAQVDAVPTKSLAAWEAYQLGKRRMAHRTGAGLAEAEQSFKTAIDLDPQFALAYAGLADALTLQTDYQTDYGRTPPDATLARADAAAATALKLDPKLAEAWTSSANVASSRNQVDRAELMYRKAIELNPNYATAHHWLSGLLSDRDDRMDEALAYAEKAAALDPLSAIINSHLATMLEASGRFAEADTRFRKAIAVDPAMPHAYFSLVLLDAYVLNRFADAVPLLKKAYDLEPDNPAPALWQAGVLLDLGDVSEAIRSTRAIQTRWPDDGWVNAVSALIYTCQGDLDAAVRSARTALGIDPRDGFALRVLASADLKKGDAGTARSRYAQAYPELLAAAPPAIDVSNRETAITLAAVLQRTGEAERAKWLLDGSEQFIRTKPRRLGSEGYGIGDVQIHALRGDIAKALAALREAERAGWRGPLWRCARDVDPALASIRNEPEFKAVFADIERDMARQRAELAARPKNAPLDLKEAVE